MNTGYRTLISFLFSLLFLWLGIRWLLPLLLPFALGALLALAAEPLVRPLHRRAHLPRALASGIGVSTAFCALALLALLLGAFLLRELGLLAGVLPDLADSASGGISLLQNWLLDLSRRTPDGIRPLLERNVTTFFSGGTALMNRALQYVLGLAGKGLKSLPDSALALGTAMLSGFMISARLPKIRNWLRTRLPAEKIRPIIKAARRIRATVCRWLSAQCKLAGITLLLLCAGLLLLRIPYAPLWAAGITLLDALPVLGTGAVLLPWAFICWLRQDGARALGLLGICVTVTVVRSILEPKLLGKELGLDPLVTLIALYAGYQIRGLAGMLLAPLLTVTALQLLPRRKGQTS